MPNSTFKRAWLDRRNKTGVVTRINLTEADLHTAGARFDSTELPTIHVEFADGTIVRPFRFAEVIRDGDITFSVDESGNSVAEL